MSRLSVPLLRRSLTESWRSTVGFSAGMAAAILLYVPLYSSFSGKNAGFQNLVDSLPAGLATTLGFQDLTSGAGYVQATVLGLIGFALMTIAATLWSSAAIGGDEESGCLELTLAHGVSRVQVMLERGVAVVLRLAFLAAVAGVFIIVLNDSSGIDLDVANVIAGCCALLVTAVLTASVGLAVGGITGRRAYASAAAATVAVAGYALNSIGNQSTDLAWVHTLSPYFWAFGSAPLATGADWGAVALLLASAAIVLMIGTIVFNRRDLAA